MRKKIPATYFLLLLLLLLLLSASRELTEQIRGTALAFAAPTWQQLASIKSWMSRAASKPPEEDFCSLEAFQTLQLENKLLYTELRHIKESLQREKLLLDQLLQVSEIDKESAADLKKKQRLQRKKLANLVAATPGKVIFRSLALWNSSLWIDLGEHTNSTHGKTVVAKNSPVLSGTSLVGVVDYVGKHQSRVRLITDSGLTPSVRVKREKDADALIKEKIIHLLLLLEKQRGPGNKETAEALENALKSSLLSLNKKENSCWYLAKGELQGTSKPLWRTSRHLLKGHGFNYDYADGEGPARDLRTGQPIGEEEQLTTMPIVQPDDLLVTTGMDGVFPPDLLVAQVTTVTPLKEGDYFYELEAIPAAGNLDDLTTVFVLPPSDYDPNDQPRRLGI
jgi:cell shape-determining protein MreC